jgi:hypothetical protein
MLRVLNGYRAFITADNSNSQQSRAGMPNEGLGVAAIGLEHFKAAMAGHVGDLDQIGAEPPTGGRRSHMSRRRATTWRPPR